jgi:hypothetical protein
MTSATSEPRGLGVSPDTIRRWQDLGLIASPETAAEGDRLNDSVEQGRGTSQIPPIVEDWLPALNIEPAED